MCTSRRRARTGFSPVSPNISLFLRQKFYDFIVVFCLMRECTAGTIFDFPAVRYDISAFPETILVFVHGAVAEQTIDSVLAFMTGIIFAFPVFKVSVCIFHNSNYITVCMECQLCASGGMCKKYIGNVGCDAHIAPQTYYIRNGRM